MHAERGSFQEASSARVAAMSDAPEVDARRLAEEARDRVRFEEEALDLADQVYRVARRLVSTREEAEDLMQETYARAFRSWGSFQPGTNMRAWLLRILTNLNIDRGRRVQRAPTPSRSRKATTSSTTSSKRTGARPRAASTTGSRRTTRSPPSRRCRTTSAT